MSDTITNGGDEGTRRYFLESVGLSAVGVTVLGSGAFTWQYLSPNVLFEPPSTFRAGKPDSYGPGSVRSFDEHKTYVVRQRDGSFYAMSSVCTHLGCLTAWKSTEDAAACPCHGSLFSRHGEVLAGPAPSPLPHYLTALDARGEIVVDRNIIVDRDTILKV